MQRLPQRSPLGIISGPQIMMMMRLTRRLKLLMKNLMKRKTKPREKSCPPPMSQSGYTTATLFSMCQDGGGEEEGGLASKPSRSSSSLKRPRLMSMSSPTVVEIENDEGSGRAF